MKKPVTFNRSKLSLLLWVLCLINIPFFIGCDTSYKEKRAKEDAKIKAYLEVEKRIEASIIQAFNEKHNPVSFPDTSTSGVNLFTYNFQEFFKRNSDRLVFFKGFVEDVEQTDSGLIIEFSVKYGVPYDTSSVVTFRLSSNQSQADEVVDIPHDRDYVIIYPNYYVVCKVKDVKTIRQHEIKRKDFFTDELYIMPTTGIEISGEMIDMFVKKKKKRSVPSSEIKENQKAN